MSKWKKEELKNQLIINTTEKETMLKGTMKKEDENVLNALADLGTDDIMSLIEKGRNKEAIIIGVKMGLTKEDVKKTIKEYKESTKK